jgi:uncharacterized protein
MFIEIEDLQQELLEVRHVYLIEQLGLGRQDAALSEPVSADFTLTHKERDLHIRGAVKTAVRYKCSRCLKEVARPLATSFDVVYLPQPNLKIDEEIELKYEDMETGFYDGVRLDVDQMVLEQIELAIPMKFVCGEDCKGLCDICGADLNEGACACPRNESGSRLAELLEFRKRMEK